MADFSKYYRAYMYMQELLKNDFTYNYINEGFKDGDKGNDSLDGKTNEKVIDMDWVVAIEETLPYIQKAIDAGAITNNGFNVLVQADAIQADGFDSVDAAIAGYTNNGK